MLRTLLSTEGPRLHIVGADDPVHPVSLSLRRGRRPAVERSGTNALGVRRPVSAAAPRCKAPAGRGAVGAGDWGRGIAVRYRSLRQRYALPPPSQREARGNGFPRQCAHWLGMKGERGGQGRPPLQSGTRATRKRDVVPQGHLFRCAPRQDAVPYGRFNAPAP